MGWLPDWGRWRRDWILRRHVLDEALWQAVLTHYDCLRALREDERRRLKELVVLFLHEKALHGARGLAVTEAMRIAIAAQACLLVLGLDLKYYKDWREVIVYPGAFLARHEFVDEYGVAHHVAAAMTGESWERGPVILSWADAERMGPQAAHNVVIHEFAHKLDMLNGAANGYPPLHADMSRERWSRVFTAAYDDLCERVGAEEETGIDEYGATTPAEFFAVATETFFESPRQLQEAYPLVYRELARFYRQDPAARQGENRIYRALRFP